MHYSIIVFSYPYICLGTFSAIFRGVDESSQSSMHPIHLQEDKWDSVIVTYNNYTLCKWIGCIEDNELSSTSLKMALKVPKHM
jgi:hypothetical protein